MIKYLPALSLMLIFTCRFSPAQENSGSISSKISQVTVFQNTAQVVREANVSLQKGQKTFILKDISPYIVPNSLQVKAFGDFTVLSVNHMTDFTENLEENEQIKELRKKIDVLERETEEINTRIGVLREEESFLITNKLITGNEGLDVQNLKSIYEFFSSRISAIRSEILEKERELKRKKEELAGLKRQLSQLKGQNKLPSHEIHVSVKAESTVDAGFSISYLVEAAGWYPSYDIRVGELGEPVSMVYKANVFQNTGVDWHNVLLNFSNAMPHISGNIPELSTWYLNFPELRIRGMSPRNDKKAEPAMVEDNEMIALAKPREAQLSEVVVVQNVTSFSFNVEVPYSVASGGEEKTIDMQRLSLPATFNHKAVPRAEESAFLVAGIHNWEQYNLMNGEANLYFENTFVGSSYLNPASTRDTLNVSLGRDQGIVVEREKRSEFTGEKFIGSNRIDTRSWKIIIRNTKQKAIDIKILDQVPVSANKEIEVEVEELSNGDLDELTGIVSWNLNIPAGESKTLVLTYQVKYPKDRELWIE